VKKVFVILGGVVVLAIVAVLVLVSSAGAIIKSTIETVGSKATQTAVTLDEVDLSLTTGAGELKGLSIGNPEGFETDSAFEMGLIRVAIDTSTIGSDVVVVNEIVIDRPRVTYEIDKSFSTNIGTIQANVDAFVKGLVGKGGGEPAPEEPASEEPASQTKVIIEKLAVRGGRVTIAASFLGSKGAGVDLPEVNLTDIGKDDGGATPEEVAATILDAITSGVLEAVSDANIEGVSDTAKKALDDVGKQAEGLLEKAGGAIKDLFGK